MHSFFLKILGVLFIFPLLYFVYSCGGGTSNNSSNLCDNSGVTSYTYLMAFHTCTSSTCGDATKHVIYLAGSNDGISWTLIPQFSGISGSVPDLIFYNDFLYIFHAGNFQKNWAKLNACFQTVATGNASLTSSTDTGGFVDPSLILSGSDLILFYLPGSVGSDPAGCTTYPCTKEIHSATADSASLESFTQVSGARVQATLDGSSLLTFSDPDIVAKSDGSYLLYVSAGQDTLVYTGTSLTGTFSSPDGSTLREISNNSGGVPSAIEVSGQIWLYVTTSGQSGVSTIRRAVSSDGITALADSAFSTVISSSVSSGFSSDTSVSSPSIITWPPSTWSKVQ